MKNSPGSVGILLVGIIIGTSAMGMLQGVLYQKYRSKWPTKVFVDLRNKVKRGLVLIEKRF